MYTSLRRSSAVQKLIERALEPEVWKRHLDEDLMKFWDRVEAYDMEDGLFPTYRTNKGETLPENPEDYPEELKAALDSEDTKGLVETDYNFIRAHSRQTYAYGIAFHMTGNEKYLMLCRKGAVTLVDAMDGNYGMFVKKNRKNGKWDADRAARTSQDLAYVSRGVL